VKGRTSWIFQKEVQKMTPTPTMILLAVAMTFSGSVLVAQKPANDPSARLREVLPADVAERVIARIAEARARELPAAALEQRALKFAAKGVDPKSIEKSVTDHSDRLNKAKKALDAGMKRKPSEDEVEAGAEAIRKGVDGAKVSELARTAPSGRSLAVPLYVLSSLIDRGLPSDEAHKRVYERLQARATDREIEKLPGEAAVAEKAKIDRRTEEKKVTADRPAKELPDVATTRSGGRAGGTAAATRPTAGPPAGVPGNAGQSAKPATPPRQMGKPNTPGNGRN
jgi:hypothetical protein